jgi:hypothetical protein
MVFACAAAEEAVSAEATINEKAIGNKKFSGDGEKIEEQNHRFPDGAYGFGWGYIPRRIYTPTTNPKEFAARQLRSLYCNSNAIVVATLLNSKSFLNDEESLVLTTWRFKVINALKSDGRMSSENTISLVMPGGEVEKDSKRIRIKNMFIGEYEKGKEYLLFLDRPADGTSPVYFTFEPKLEVSAGQVELVSTNSWMGYASGFRIDDLMKDTQAALDNNRCP